MVFFAGKVAGITANWPPASICIVHTSMKSPDRAEYSVPSPSRSFEGLRLCKKKTKNKKDVTRYKWRPRRATEMNKYLNDLLSLPPGGEPTTTMRMLHGAYQTAKIIEAVENSSSGFLQKVKCPGAPKVSHPHFPSDRPHIKSSLFLTVPLLPWPCFFKPKGKTPLNCIQNFFFGSSSPPKNNF